MPDGGEVVAADGGSQAADGGATETLTPESLGRAAVTYLKNNDFNGFYSRIVATRELVRASCSGLSGVDPYFDSGDGSIAAQQGAWNDCRSRLNIGQVTLAAVRVVPQVARLVPPACTGDVPRANVTVELRTMTGTAFYFTLGEVMTFGAQARLYGKLRDCGSATTLADGGVPSPVVSISATPATATVGQLVTFTAAISSGTPPYNDTCSWRFLAGDNPITGTVSGSACTGTYTYTQAGDFTVSVEVTDRASRIGQSARTYSVTGGSTGGQQDLIVRSQSLQTVSPPALNRYPRGAPVEIQFIAKNIGSGDAPATSVRLLLRDPVSRAETTLGTVPIGALTSGAEQAVRQTFTIASAQPPLVYDLVAIIDPARVTADANRANNEVTFLWIEVIN